MKDGTQPSASFTEQSLFCKLTVLLSTGLYPKPEILFCFQNIWTQIYVFKTLKISTVCFNLPAVYVQCWYAWELTIIVGEQKLFTNLFYYCCKLFFTVHIEKYCDLSKVWFFRFKSYSVYNHHMKIHSDERNYKCSFCPKTFKTAVQLAGHKNR